MANKKQPTWESLIAKRNELHGDFKPLRMRMVTTLDVAELQDIFDTILTQYA